MYYFAPITINIYVIVYINLLQMCMRRHFINYKVASVRAVFFQTLAEIIFDHILHFILNTDILLLLYNNYWTHKTLLESWILNLESWILNLESWIIALYAWLDKDYSSPGMIIHDIWYTISPLVWPIPGGLFKGEWVGEKSKKILQLQVQKNFNWWLVPMKIENWNI